ncbi:MAG TPA: hypothetical protein VFU24_02225 [Burkholderiales bacterium]|nr:hypothetical protein [Burkholderiales bacterium]
MRVRLRVALAALMTAAAAPGAGAQDTNAEEPWGLAPVRWRGFVAADLRSFSAEGQPRRLERVGSGQLQFSSYVWQPWFAQLEGGIGGVASSGGDGATRSDTLTGNGLLNIFPVSRFPFQANFEVSDSRTSDQFTGQTFQTRRYGVRQSHRDPAGEGASTGSFDRSTFVSAAQGRDTLDVLNASHVRRLGAHTLDGNANLTRNARDGTDEHSDFTRLSGRHAWTEAGLVTVDTTVSYGASDQRLASSGLAGAARAESFQVNSFFSGRRDEDDPWSVTGGVRYFQNETSGLGDVTLYSLAGHVNAAYRYSRQLVLNAGASATQNSSAGEDASLATLSAGANYTMDTLRLGDYLYNVTVGGNLLEQLGEPSVERDVVSAQAGHNLQRTLDFVGAQALTLTLAQSVNEVQDSVAGGLFTLTNNASAMWRLTRADGLAGFVSASAADSRSRGYNDSVFQLLNVQLSGQGQVSRYSTLLANLTVQGTREGTQQAQGGFNVNRNGGITYQHQRAFGVPRLRYLAIYERNDYRLNSRAQGDLNAPREQLGESFEQRLEYRIGKLEARLTVRFAELDGKDNALVFFRVARELGNW